MFRYNIINFVKKSTPEIKIFNITVENDNTNITISKTGSPTSVTLQYSKDAKNWSTISFGSAISVNTDEKLYIRNTSETTTNFNLASSGLWTPTDNIYTINGSNYFNLNGDISYLLNKNGEVTTIPSSYCFYKLFYNSTYLKDISNLILPFTTLTSYCYSFMFSDCTSLTSISENLLPSTKIYERSYFKMFYGCTSLTNICSLPATTLASTCYCSMFENCTSLTTIPEELLPATTLFEACYECMFQNCSSLTNLCNLPATNLYNINYCYYQMFNKCSKIMLSTTQTGSYTKAYRIPSTGSAGSIGTNALYQMFSETGGTFTGTPSINTTYYLYV